MDLDDESKHQTSRFCQIPSSRDTPYTVVVIMARLPFYRFFVLTCSLWLVPTVLSFARLSQRTTGGLHNQEKGVVHLPCTPPLSRFVRLAAARSDDDVDEADDEEVSTVTSAATNVLGTALQCCCANVRDTGIGTGFYRNGHCETGEQDLGRHTVCVQVTDDFLAFSAAVGNDLSTPAPQYMFPGLRDGDVWCLCAQRWAQAYQAGKAPQVILQATHEKTLDYVPLEVLRKYALDLEEADRSLDELNQQRQKLNKLL